MKDEDLTFPGAGIVGWAVWINVVAVGSGCWGRVTSDQDQWSAPEKIPQLPQGEDQTHAALTDRRVQTTNQACHGQKSLWYCHEGTPSSEQNPE